ncbi:MAG: hypothetical protein DCF24_01195 [Cyanobium sp.]|nr:MAG: hypothetical protein DCF24_01195 [Cyanobium sp.]
MSGITWRAAVSKQISEHLVMIQFTKAGKHGLLLEEARPWDVTCKVWRCPRPSGIPKYLWALLEQKLRQIEPLQMPVPVAVPARPRRGLSSQEVTLSGLVPFPAFLAMELLEAHHPDLYRREYGFPA